MSRSSSRPILPDGSLTTLVITAFLVALPGIALLLLQPLQHFDKNARHQVRVYLHAEIDHATAAILADEVENWPESTAVRLLDRDAAWREYTAHAGLAAIEPDENPLPHMLLIEASSAENAGHLGQMLRTKTEIHSLRTEPPWSKSVRKLGDAVFICFSLLLLVALRIIYDTLARHALRYPSPESRLIFIITGLGLGFCAGLLTCALIHVATIYINELFNDGFWRISATMRDFYAIIGISCGVGLLAGALSAKKPTATG